MSRRPRLWSITGYQHLVIRGNGKQVIFEDQSDYRFFLQMLKRYCEETGVVTNAYCLMGNHVHILVYDPQRQSSLLMKKLETCYAGYFNEKYERTGHLFQGRFRSENIDSTRYLCSVFRYILKNPEKAGISPATSYEWNSYAEYGRRDSFTDTEVFQTLIGDRTALDQFLSTEDDECCMEYHAYSSEEWAKERICTLLHVSNTTVLQTYGKSERDEAIRILKKAGISIRQIERLTGIGRNIIQRA